MKSPAELATIAERVKLTARRPDVLALCDAFLTRPQLEPSGRPMPAVISEAQRVTRREKTNEQAKLRMRAKRARDKAAANGRQ